MTRDDLFGVLARLRLAPVANVRAPHKPLLLLWLFGRFASAGSSVAAYAEAEGPVSDLINEFGPPVRSPSAARRRAAMPFMHLERELWDLRDGQGREITPDQPDRSSWLTGCGAVGRLRPGVEGLLSDRGTLAAAARLLLDRHFTPVLSGLICAEVNLDLPGLDAAVPPAESRMTRRRRRPGFAEEVLRAYAYQCAMCRFVGALGRMAVGIEAAHVRWHSQDGPDEVANGLALCALHHVLLDLGVLGLTADRRVCVSGLYIARSAAGKAVDALAGQPLLTARPGQPAVDTVYVNWHTVQVFKGSHQPAPA